MTARARNGGRTTISFTVQLPEEMFQLLRDVSLARHLSHVANKSLDDDATDSKTRKRVAEGMASILAGLVEQHREGLEGEAVQGGVRKRQKTE